jgi:prepilin-type N-terminal cleavage/methylation domain-containing protein/prepilin-type processing-associated H-X9-DG protein
MPTNRYEKHLHDSGFTLIELLVVLAITMILTALLIPAVQAAREVVRRLSCANNVKQLALASHNHEAIYRKLPTGFMGASSDRPYSTWLQQLLPYIEQQPVYDRATADYQFNAIPFSHRGMQTLISTFQCPSDTASGRLLITHYNRVVTTTSYLGVSGTNYRERNGVLFLNSKTRMSDIVDGLSQTIFIGERPPSPDFWYGWWYAGAGIAESGTADMLLGVSEVNDPKGSFLQNCPTGPYGFIAGNAENQCDALHYWSFHSGGAQFAFCDGSVRFISFETKLLLPQLATRSGREVVLVLD